MHRPGGRTAEPGRAGGKEKGTASDLTIPTGPALQLANAGTLLQPRKGRGPGQPPGAVPSGGRTLPTAWGMSLLANYEGLRHQIERLVRENEELKKLVRLIRENHELKSEIQMQAGGLGISGFTGRLGEAATGPSQHQGNCKA